MEQFQEYREKADKYVMIADHLLIMTYPMVKDPKLLITVLDNIFEAMLAAATSLLWYERTFKNIGSFGDSPEERIRLFSHTARKRGIDEKFIKTLLELRDLKNAHKDSPMEFSRKEKFVMMSDSNEVRALTEGMMKLHLSLAKEFVKKMTSETAENEGIFRGRN